MVNDEERCFLALSILDGELEAHRILADLLEEEGDAGLANWARSRKGRNHRKRFEISIGVLPAKVDVALAAEFALHMMQWLDRPYPEMSPFAANVDVVLKWAKGETRDAFLVAACQEFATASFFDLAGADRMYGEDNVIYGALPGETVWQLGLALSSLARAAQSALDSAESREPRMIRHFRNETAHLTRATAKACREELCHHIYPQNIDEHLAFHAMGHYGNANRYRYHKHSNVPGRNELTWQMEHVREVLRDLTGEM